MSFSSRTSKKKLARNSRKWRPCGKIKERKGKRPRTERKNAKAVRNTTLAVYERREPRDASIERNLFATRKKRLALVANRPTCARYNRNSRGFDHRRKLARCSNRISYLLRSFFLFLRLLLSSLFSTIE